MQPVGWHIEVEFQEDDTRTEAAARLRLRDGVNWPRVAQPGVTRMTSHTSGRRSQLHGHCLIWCTSCSTRPRPRSRQLISLHTCRCELTGYRRGTPTGSARRFAAGQRCRR